MSNVNDHLLLICGPSKGGKSTSLHGLINPERKLYLNAEAGKRLTFPSKFREKVIADPLLDVFGAFNQANKVADDKCDTVIIDSLTYLLQMYVSKKVLTADNPQAAWMQFQEYFRSLMQDYVALSSKTCIFTAHTQPIMNDHEKIIETKVPVQGGLARTGIESYFSIIVSAKKMPLSELEEYENDLLTITPEDKAIGVKNVFQTKLTEETVHERISSPMGMWDLKETFIDNNAQLVIDRLNQYYGLKEAA